MSRIGLMVALTTICALATLAVSAPVAAAAGSSPSLPQQTGSRPGPSILYRPPAKAPQFVNTGIWHAAPIHVCNTSADRKGEFLYQDCINDDHGGGTFHTWPSYTYLKDYTYPTATRYRGNAADLVEVRMKPTRAGTAFRITYNTMTQPGLAATTIALGGSAKALPAPHGANTVMPARVFVTVHGNTGDIVDAATGRALSVRPTVRTDLVHRQVNVIVPYRAYDSRGKTSVRVAAASGLWNAAAGRYLVPQTTATATQPGGAPPGDAPPSAFFNAAFRYHEPFSPFRDEQQLQAIAAGNITPFHAVVNFVKLARHVTDNRGVPTSGYVERIYASHFESEQGLRLPGDKNGPPQLTGTQQNGGQPGIANSNPGKSTSLAFGWPCDQSCVPDVAGNLLTYTAYIPKTRPAAGYGTFLFTPGYAITPNDSVYGPPDLYRSVANRPGNPTIVADIASRGADEWFYGQSGASVFEAWADLARHYKLNPARTTMAGFSSGAYGANKLSLQFPDVFGKAFICDGLDRAPSFPGINGVADTGPVDTVTRHRLGSDIEPLLASRYDQPVMEWAGVNDDFIPYNITRRRADAYAAGSYDYQFISWTGLAAEHLTMCNDGTFSVLDNWLGSSTRAVNPARVQYVRDPAMDDPRDGMVGDHAYWLSHIQTRATAPVTGTIDVFSKGLGQADRTSTPPTGKPVGADPLGTLINAFPDPANLLKQIKTGQPLTPNPQPGFVQQLVGALQGTKLESTPSDGFPIGSPGARTKLPVNYYLREYRHYGTPAAAPAQNELDIDAINVRAVTIDPRRAKVTCHAVMKVHSDGPLTVKLAGCRARHFG